jgi:phytoene dehydrogenase-like protein
VSGAGLRVVVVGSGPNGLTAAAVLARAGADVTVLEAADTIGGGTRTSDLTGDGLLHDHCSAVHPLAAGSPGLQTLDLHRYGLTWCQPEVDLVHPLDDGSAGVLVKDLERTAALLGADGPRWTRLVRPTVDHLPALLGEVMRPLAHVPRHPVVLARYGLHAVQPATREAGRFGTEPARALFGGLAAHTMQPLTGPGTAATAVLLGAACHRYGWVVARGGSRAITDALAAIVTSHGGRIETGVTVRSLADVGPYDALVLNLSPTGAASVLGDALPQRVRRAFASWRYGPAAFKVDFSVHGGVPWTNEAARSAGTVHLGGTFAQVAAAEADVAAGRMPARPFVLVGQQYLADPSRSRGDLHPLWTYAHVPRGFEGDATEAIIGQVERFAPGFRERISRSFVRSATELAQYNRNYVGGDIATGANSLHQLLVRPRATLAPYRVGIPGVYLSSAATPPGAGVHGMAGYQVAQLVLRDRDRPSRR